MSVTAIKDFRDCVDFVEDTMGLDGYDGLREARKLARNLGIDPDYVEVTTLRHRNGLVSFA